jgi:hypothetical protein
MLPSVLLAEDKAAIMKDMKAQEEAVTAIQKGLPYDSKEGVADGIKALKVANKIAALKDNLADYLPKEKKALHKTALKEGEFVNKYAGEMQKSLRREVITRRL